MSSQDKALIPVQNRMPNVPTIESINSIEALVKMAVRSGLAKTKRAEDAFFVVMYGLELGVPPMTALRTIYSVNGGAPTCSGELLLALIRRSGKASIKISSTEDTLKNKRATVHMKRVDSGDEFTATWGETDDSRAGLKSNRDKYPAQMWTWRAVSIAAKALCSDIVGGLYTVEEIYPETPLDEEGAPIGDVVSDSLSKPITQSQPAAEAAEPVTPPSADEPTQQHEPETVPSWASIETNFKLFKGFCMKITGDWDAIVPGLVKDKGITDINNPAQWGKAFAIGREAGAFVEQAFNNAMSNEPPAQPKSKATTKATHKWTEAEIETMDTTAGRFWDPVMLQHLDPKEALRLMEKTAWSEFGDPTVAVAALRTMCIQKVMPIVATAATYMKGKHSEVTNGILDVRKFGLREELKKLSDEWDVYVETWEKGQTYTFGEDEMASLIVNWTLADGVPTMSKVSILELTF